MCKGVIVRIMTREHIKPSSPTPENNRYIKLSLLDHLTFPMSGPYFLFYPQEHGTAATNITQKSQLLKSSLSKVLTLYYPLAAGKIKDNSLIECDDSGVEYIETQVSSPMSLFLQRLDSEALENDLLIINLDRPTTKDEFINAVIQVNFFVCGGVAIGFSVSHKIMDGVSISTFLLAWAAAAANNNNKLSKGDPPYFVSDSIIPSLKNFVPPATPRSPSCLDTIKYPTRRYVFEASKVRLLKAQAMTRSVQRPTRVEVVTALIWKCLMVVSSTKQHSVVMHAVNLRKRFSPPLSHNYVGNLTGRFLTEPKMRKNANLKELVACLRKGLTKNLEILKRSNVQENNKIVALILDFAKEVESYMNGRDDVELYSFSSSCGFPFYEVDFGWGKPTWVTYTNLGVKNFAMFLDASDGEGVEVCLSIGEDDAILLERETVLLDFASVNSNPCGVKSLVRLQSVICNSSISKLLQENL